MLKYSTFSVSSLKTWLLREYWNSIFLTTAVHFLRLIAYDFLSACSSRRPLCCWHYMTPPDSSLKQHWKWHQPGYFSAWHTSGTWETIQSYTSVASPSEVFLSSCFAVSSRYKNFRLFIHQLHIVYCSQIPQRSVSTMTDSLPPPPFPSMGMRRKMTGKVSFFLPNVFSSFLFNLSLFMSSRGR